MEHVSFLWDWCSLLLLSVHCPDFGTMQLCTSLRTMDSFLHSVRININRWMAIPSQVARYGIKQVASRVSSHPRVQG